MVQQKTTAKFATNKYLYADDRCIYSYVIDSYLRGAKYDNYWIRNVDQTKETKNHVNEFLITQ